MVIRKPLPTSGNREPDGTTPTAAQSGVPVILRPGLYPNTATAPAYAGFNNFEQEEESVWSRPGQSAPQEPTQAPPPPPPPGPVPNLNAIPAVLQPGGGATPPSVETNPFKRKLQAAHTGEVPSAGFGQLSINDSRNNPWQPALNNNGNSREPSPAAPAVRLGDTAASGDNNVWASRPVGLPSELLPQPTAQLSTSSAKPARLSEPNLINFGPEDERDSAGWDEIASPKTAPPPPARPPFVKEDEDDEAVYEDRHAWDELGSDSKKPAKSKSTDLRTEAASEDWNLVDSRIRPGQLSRQSTWENFTDDEADGSKSDEPATGSAKAANVAVAVGETSKAVAAATTATAAIGKGKGKDSDDLISIAQDDEPSTAPANNSKPATVPQQQPPVRSLLDIDDVEPPTQPPRPVVKDKTETYQIKNIAWQDIHAAKNPRVSPILLQNANGPCPLVALVNALSLTTPAETSTALVEALRSREQVSLALLLDAVFDELMSSRRTDGERALPDVDELYRFLKGLHTGMNVNPRFVPTPEAITAMKRTSLTHVHPTQRNDAIPGTFEDAREMQLYATFNIPLIHGWIPAKEDAVYGAMSRRAASYEDVQNLLFREEELELKLSSPTSDGLTEEEQELYQDILEIKTFLNSFPTQLTPFGLDVLAKSMTPGSIAILFRNDHFSTLYRHPQTMQLLSLVTDAGYASHDEIIWETLVDVNGERTEFYSGDFRLVSGNGHHAEHGQSSAVASSSGGPRVPGAFPDQNSAGPGGKWTTVQSKRNKDQPPSSADNASRSEQEDRDLALALQLQEEEEERHRAEEERRSRESRLSEQFIEQQARQSTPNLNSGRGRGTTASNAAGGGRYNSTTQLPISPRRSSNSAASASHGRTSSASAASSLSNTTTSAQSRHRQRPSYPSAPQQPPRPQQVVRPLVPPATNPRPPVHRPVDPDNDDEAPPSYEQAAKQAPYHPPDPQNPSAGLGGSSNSSNMPPGRPYGGGGGGGGGSSRPGVYAQNPLQQQQPQRYQQAQVNRDRDRDCVIM